MWKNKIFNTWAILFVLAAACNPRPTIASVTPEITPGAVSTCPDMPAVIKAFLDSNDAARYDESLAYLTPDVSYSSWAEGVNGSHWQEKHLRGREAVRPFLIQRGLRRSADEPQGPVYHEGKPTLSGDHLSIILQPDRLSPRGREYNPYQVEAAFDRCKIKSLKVIQFISWE